MIRILVLVIVSVLYGCSIIPKKHQSSPKISIHSDIAGLEYFIDDSFESSKCNSVEQFSISIGDTLHVIDETYEWQYFTIYLAEGYGNTVSLCAKDESGKVSYIEKITIRYGTPKEVKLKCEMTGLEYSPYKCVTLN